MTTTPTTTATHTITAVDLSDIMASSLSTNGCSRSSDIGTDVKKLFQKTNVTCVGRTLDASSENIIFEKQKIKDIKNIVWATGFKPNFNWIEGVELDADQYPKNYRGVSEMNGLYFIGLPWLYTRGSATLGGVKKDAAYLVEMLLKNHRL